jgi:hypothetical protein
LRFLVSRFLSDGIRHSKSSSSSGSSSSVLSGAILWNGVGEFGCLDSHCKVERTYGSGFNTDAKGERPKCGL